jgi:LysM repeat protein
MKRRTALATPVVLGLAVLGVGCAADDASVSPTVAPIQPTSYVVKELVTTTTTTLPPTTTTVLGQLMEPIEYIIVSGDNPSRVAERFSISIQQLAEANATNPVYTNFLLGGTLIIPPGAVLPEAVATAVATGGATSGANCPFEQHEVVAGDNPTVVARKYETSIEALARANATNPVYSSFIIGGSLIIPVGDC